MKSRYRIYWKVNLASIFFIVLSFVSVTLAWFAYSGLSNLSTEMGVKAWNIELNKNGEQLSSDMVISLTEIYPGMETITEIVNIRNLGDSDAQIKYSIVSARILDNPDDNFVVNETTTIKSEYVEDVLSHNYPFHININLSKKYLLAKGDEASFEVSISWPLDSESDEIDSLWGNAAYQFQKEEEEKKKEDENYQIRPAIQIVLVLTAEQYVKTDTASDPNYNLGDMILFDVENNQRCEEVSTTCLETYVIDVDNVMSNEVVSLLPNPNKPYYNDNEVYNGYYDEYQTIFEGVTSDWNVETRALTVEDILRIISRDIINSVLVRESISDRIIGNLNYENRIVTELERATNKNGYYRFVNENFNYLSSIGCYWTSSEYDDINAFAVKQISETYSKLYDEKKDSICNVIPVILANKADLENTQ
jgi:hypothetical protein